MDERYLTVTALTKYIKYKFDHDVHFSNVLLEGEISNFKRHSRGHFYFTLKDNDAQISAMMFQSQASTVKFEPKDGMKVFVRGIVTVYQQGGSYQINVKEMKSDGVGDLYLKFEELKKELNALGWFSMDHKKPIPRIPNVIGVITSPTGAAVHDIINTVSRRFPLCKIILYPALVQGDDAKNSIVSCLKKANTDKLCDVIICGRGGGSFEDLWAFNEKIVAKAIYESEIPVISAVGHEVDFTIADFVADRRAATPTAAAELATPVIENLRLDLRKNIDKIEHSIRTILDNKRTMILNAERRLDFSRPQMGQYKLDIDNLMKRIEYATKNILDSKRVKLDSLKKYLENNTPNEKLKQKRLDLINYNKKMDILVKNILSSKKNEFNLYKEKLNALSPLTIMDKGYSIAYQNKSVLKSVKNTRKGDTLSLKLTDGIVNCEVTEVIDNDK